MSQTAAAELALANPFVEDQSHLRPTLVMGLLDSILAQPVARGTPSMQLSEVGRIFVERNGHNLECAAAAFVMADDAARQWQRREPADFFTVKHHLAAVAAAGGQSTSRPGRSSP